MLLYLTRMDKRFLLILTAIILVFGGVFWLTKSKSNAPGTGGNQSKASNHVVGANNKGVAIIEFGDYQCPSCAQYFPILQQIKTKYGDDISFRFANFPLVQIHPNAMQAARAAEAAALQGKFWEMHDLLFQNQNTWSSMGNPSSVFEQYAQSLGLDVEKFKADMTSSAVSETINADVAEAQSYGSNATPTFIINGKKIDNPTSFEEFVKVIDEALKNNQQ